MWFLDLLTYDSVSNFSTSFQFDTPTGGSYLVLKNFTTGANSESDKISDTVENSPYEFFFTDKGNIQIRTSSGIELFRYQNPLDLSTTKDFNISSIDRLKLEFEHYTFTDKMVITRNLKYILHKTGEQWQLLYNPIHSKDYAEVFMLGKEDINQERNWGASAIKDDNYENHRIILEKYCDAFKVVDNGVTKFLDPTCNIVYSPDQCAKSAVFDESNVNHVDEGLHGNLINQMSSGNPPYCVCYGNAYEYVRNNAPQTSFIHRFLDMHTCKPQINTTICNVVNKVVGDNGKIEISGSNLVSSCSNKQGTGNTFDTTNDDDEDDENKGGDQKKKVTIAITSLAVISVILAILKKIFV
jgi:hypothetical protein